MNSKIIAFSVICLLGIMLNSNLTYSQGFNSVTTPDGTNLVAVGNSGQLYRSASGGATWTSIPNGALNMNDVTSLGNDVWIAADNGTVYKTQKTPSSIITYTVGSSVVLKSIVFIDANTGFVCGNSGAVYKTVNGGVNWTSSNSGIAAVDLNSVDFKDANNGRVVGSSGNIYITSNGGTSWTSESSGTTKNLTAVKYFSTYAVATGEYGTILTNNGGSWTAVNTRTQSDIRSVTGTWSSDVHVCGGGGFIRNNKSGSSNFFNFEINPMMANLVDIFYFDTNKGWAVSSLTNVIIYTTNAGASWSMPTGATLSRSWTQKLTISGGIGNDLCPHPTDRNTMFCVNGSTVSVSRDRGETWTNISSITGGGSAHSFYVSPLDTNIWVCAITSSPDRVTKTTNYGATWTTSVSLNFSNYGQPLEMDQNDPHIFYYAPDNDGFYKSTDIGSTFTKISTTINGGVGGTAFRSPCDIITMWDSSNVIYVGDGVTGSGNAQIFKSTDGGKVWNLMYTVVASETPSLCNSVFDRTTIFATEWSGSNIYKSTNYGTNWFISHSTGFSGWASGICLEDPTVIYTGNYGSSSALSTDNGVTWLSGGSGMSGAGAGVIVPERGYILSQQTSNVYKMNFNYSYTPVVEQIDVEAFSIGDEGSKFYTTATVTPSGTVKNNNGAAPATFTVTRKITPGNYTSTKTVSNLGASSSTVVNFDPWTFNAGTLYNIKDSVYIANDGNNSNDVKTGTLTPYVGTFSNTLTEDFSSGTFPPAGWTRTGSGTQYWKRDATVTGYGTGGGSSFYDFWSANTSTPYQYLETPTFTAISSSGSLIYDYAYAPYSSGTDSLAIEYSTNGGTTYTTYILLYGNSGATGEYALNTTGVSGSEFIPASNQWQTKTWSLPAGTNRVRFRAKSGYGNNLYLDNVKIETGQAYTQLNLVLAPEGMYNGSGLNFADTVKAYLRNTSSPFAVVDSATAVINSTSLTAPCVFQNAGTGNYYIQIKHRNALESWSKSGGHSITSGVTSTYDFTNAQSQTYGSNSILIGSRFCFYSGDVNKDGIIDIADQSDIDNDAFNFSSGYVVTDLNGDMVVDLADAVIADNNASNFISKITPGVSPNEISLIKSNLQRQRAEQKEKLRNSK
ncbi:MAG: hypothetical protein JSS91_10500 [Bacteroidetes bacterium]|nr:hypothetical protein [Bacteroidota bacterium]